MGLRGLFQPLSPPAPQGVFSSWFFCFLSFPQTFCPCPFQVCESTLLIWAHWPELTPPVAMVLVPQHRREEEGLFL